MDLRQDVADAARTGRLALGRFGFCGRLLDDLSGDASDPAGDGGFGIAAAGHVGCHGIGERTGKSCCPGVSQGTGKLAESGNTCTKVSG